MWCEDLKPCDGFPTDSVLIGVGWLERGRPFAVGRTDVAVYNALVDLAANPWEPFMAMGQHGCDLCQFDAEAQGGANLFVPGDGVIYVCPAMIVHYVNAHQYAPPEVFCQAVLRCPQMRTKAYLKAILDCGGANLLEHAAEDD